METIERENYQLVEVINLKFKESGKSQRMRIKSLNTNEEVGVLVSFIADEQNFVSAIKYNYRLEKESYVELVDKINIELNEILQALYKDMKNAEANKKINSTVEKINNLEEIQIIVSDIAREIYEDILKQDFEQFKIAKKLIEKINAN